MPTIFHHARRQLIAIVAVFATSMSVADASACATPKAIECATVCGCCPTDVNGRHGDQRSVRALPAAACETIPSDGCVCRSQAPIAPAPKPARSTAEGRPDLSQSVDFAAIGVDHAARVKPLLWVPANHSPPKIPLYLRNERLLF